MADPRILRTGTLAEKAEGGGFAARHIGWSVDEMRSPERDAWKSAANALLQEIPANGGQPLFDFSFEANQTLWDRYFVSDGQLENPGGADFHGAAARLTVDGAFKNQAHFAVGHFRHPELWRGLWKWR